MSVCHLFRADSNNFSLLQTHPNIGPRTALLSHTSCLLAPPDSLLLGPLLSGTNLRSQLLCPAVGTHSCPQLPEFMPLQAGPEPACLAHHHIGTLFSPHGFMRLVPRYSEHTHTCMSLPKAHLETYHRQIKPRLFPIMPISKYCVSTEFQESSNKSHILPESHCSLVIGSVTSGGILLSCKKELNNIIWL